MCLQDHVQKMLEIQKSVEGNYEVIKPGRVGLHVRGISLKRNNGFIAAHVHYLAVSHFHIHSMTLYIYSEDQLTH